MKINAYLSFDGQCEAAFKFYAECLRGEIIAMFPFGETPAAEYVPTDYRDKIMHAALTVGDQLLMASDACPEHPYEGVKGFSVSLNVDSAAEARRVFDGLAEGGQVTMPLEKTFWAEQFGMLVDRFGVPWMVNFEGPK